MTDRVRAIGMRFLGRHGVTPEERANAQPFEVDVEVVLDLSRAAESDDLADTVDYGEIQRSCRDVVEGPPQHLLEALAGRIAERVERSFEADEVVVRVRKTGGRLVGRMDYAEVEIRRPRRDPR